MMGNEEHLLPGKTKWKDYQGRSIDPTKGDLGVFDGVNSEAKVNNG